MNAQTKMFTGEQMSGNGNQTNMIDQINATEDRIKMLKNTNHNYWYDGGHGWIEVMKEDLIMLQIANKISGYSYQDENKAYLEEDCDAGIYFRALFGDNLMSAEFSTFRTHHIIERYQENIFVRRLRHYKPFMHRLNKTDRK